MTIINIILISILTFVSALLIGPKLIRYFKRQSVKQIVQEDGLESHFIKSGTPTMGGWIFLIPTILITLIFAVVLKKMTIELMVIISSVILFGLIGFIDDYKKVVKKHNDGLTSKQKIILQFIVGLPIAIFAANTNTEMWIPFTNYYLDLGWFYGVLVLVVIIATTNAVNLTDGVDGLSTTVTILVLSFFVYLSIKISSFDYLIFSLSLMSGLFGFLMFNKNPAKIFMGDLGSLGLGGAVVTLSIFTNTLLLIPIVGVIYVIENLSVVIQVLYFKKTKKRIFRMSPIHHHFELVGWNEKKIVKNFGLVTLVGVIIGIVSLLPRL